MKSNSFENKATYKLFAYKHARYIYICVFVVLNSSLGEIIDQLWQYYSIELNIND